MTVNSRVFGLAVGFFAPALIATDVLAVSLNLIPSMQTVQVGDTVTIDVQISELGNLSAPSVGGFDLDIAFNSSILSFNNITFGDPNLGDLVDLSGADLGDFDDSTPGIVNFSDVSLDDPADLNAAQPDSFILARLRFNAIGVGSTSLGLSVNDLIDENTDPLTVTDLGEALINVNPRTITTTPEPTVSLLGLGLVFGLSIGLKRKYSRY